MRSATVGKTGLSRAVATLLILGAIGLAATGRAYAGDGGSVAGTTGQGASAATGAARPRRVVGYFPLWIRNGGYTENDVDFSVINTVAHFSVVPRVDGSLEVPDWGPFPDPLLVAKTHAAGASIVLVVGGDHAAATQGFAAMAATAGSRQSFITNLMRIVATNGYDGVDLDWEFPTAADTDNLSALVRELRDALGASRTLSITGPASDWYGRAYDFAALVPNLDWIGAMTYALSGASWSEYADNNAGLYASREGELSVDGSRAYYLGRGVPVEKLLIGLPFYGQRFDNAATLHQPLSGKAGGALDYPDISRLVGNGWTAHRDDSAAVPYLVRNDDVGIISYDDAVSITAKCRYVADRGLAGAMIWHLGQDRLGSAQPLLQAARACR